jgi:hypothetical protein
MAEITKEEADQREYSIEQLPNGRYRGLRYGKPLPSGWGMTTNALDKAQRLIDDYKVSREFEQRLIVAGLISESGNGRAF